MSVEKPPEYWPELRSRLPLVVVEQGSRRALPTKRTNRFQRRDDARDGSLRGYFRFRNLSATKTAATARPKMLIVPGSGTATGKAIAGAASNAKPSVVPST